MSKKNKYTLIVGCGRLGTALARRLSEEDANLVVIDQSEDATKSLGISFSGLVIVGNATDINVLIEAGIERADIVLAATNDDNTNIMISLIAKEMFFVKKVISRLYDETRKVAYSDLQIDLVCPAELSVNDLYSKLIEN